jgi:hypothetical protein
MMRRSILAAVFGLLAPAVARAGPVFEFTSTGTLTGSDISLGFRFTTNQAISVVALDAHVVSAAGSQVRLYDASGTTLASATVLPTDPMEGSPTSFYSHAITPVELQAGQTYYVAEDYAAGDPPSLWDITFTSVDPSVTYGAPVSEFGLGLNPMSNVFGFIVHDGLFGPNFDIASVPEPSTRVLVMAAMVFGPGSIWLSNRTRRSRTGPRGGVDRPGGRAALGSSG